MISSRFPSFTVFHCCDGLPRMDTQESLLLGRSSHAFSWHRQCIKWTKYKCGKMIILSQDNTVIVFSVFNADWFSSQTEYWNLFCYCSSLFLHTI